MEPIIIDGWSFDSDNLMTPAEVGRTFHVDRKTVTHWARDGRLAFIRTPGGQRRYSRQQVEAIMRGEVSR